MNGIATLLVRAVLLVVVGLAGWLLGGIAGLLAGVGLDALLGNLDAAAPSSVGFVLGLVGALGGAIGAVAWIGRSRRSG